MTYFLTLIGAVALFFLIVYLRYLTIRWGLKDRNYTQVQRSLKVAPPLSSEGGFLSGSKVSQSSPEDTDRRDRPKAKKYQPFRTIADIRRSYIIDSLLDKPRWRDEWTDRTMQ